MNKKGFTLIELLIVVAIIAILAAIAVPNFLEAQVRSKVSRCKADMRTLATAIESYVVDHNTPPTDAGNGVNGIIRPYPPGNIPTANFTIGFELTTPISYLSSLAPLVDVFKATRSDIQNSPGLEGRQYYNFANWLGRHRAPSPISDTAFGILTERDGAWILFGAGPDRYTNNSPGGTQDFGVVVRIPMRISYDPTNGTVSRGDIYRSQKYGSGVFEMDLIN